MPSALLLWGMPWVFARLGLVISAPLCSQLTFFYMESCYFILIRWVGSIMVISSERTEISYKGIRPCLSVENLD